MNSEVVGGGGRKSREHKRYLSIGESEGGAVFNEEGEGGGEDVASGRPGSRIVYERQGGNAAAAAAAVAGNGGERVRDTDDERPRRAANGKENVALPTREMRVFGGMTRLGPVGAQGTNGFGKDPDGSMYDGDGFLKELDAWIR